MEANPTTEQTTFAEIESTPSLERGDWAIHSDSKNNDELLVLNNTENTAREHIVNEMPEGEPDRTIHRITDSKFDADDAVIETVYLDSINRAVDSWTVEEILDMYTPGENNHAGEIDHANLRVYGFHASRIEKTQSSR